MKRQQWLGFAILVVVLAPQAWAAQFQVIVNASNSINSISKTMLQDYYLGKATRWANGTTVVAVDLTEHSDVRADFSKTVLAKTVGNVKSYWLTIIFAGRGVPPAELDSDDQVIEAVRKGKGTIGYVSTTVPLPSGVKGIKVE